LEKRGLQWSGRRRGVGPKGSYPDRLLKGKKEREEGSWGVCWNMAADHWCEKREVPSYKRGEESTEEEEKLRSKKTPILLLTGDHRQAVRKGCEKSALKMPNLGHLRGKKEETGRRGKVLLDATWDTPRKKKEGQGPFFQGDVCITNAR